MDSDSSFLSEIVEEYLKFINENDTKDIAVLSPVHIYDRGRKNGYEGSREVRWAMTSGCFYHIGIFKKAGGFKEELFVDGLDIDYCYKVRGEGYRTVEIGSAMLRHYPGETKVFRFAGRELLRYGYASPWRYYMQARALIWLIWKYKRLGDVLRYAAKWGKTLFFFDHKGTYIREILKGSREGIALWAQDKAGD